MDDAGAKVIDLIFGRWRSQILYTGVKLGIFDALASGPQSAGQVASALGVDAGMLYRLMRALSSLELLHEDHPQTFSLTSMGEWLHKDHPHTLRGMALLEEGPEHYAIWKHLPDLIQEGQQNAFVREFGQPLFEYAVQHPSYGAVFNEAMSSYSSMDNALVLEALDPYDFSSIAHLCDIGGGHGLTLCSLLVKHPHLQAGSFNFRIGVALQALERDKGLCSRWDFACPASPHKPQPSPQVEPDDSTSTSTH